jgi:hypothetical protein
MLSPKLFQSKSQQFLKQFSKCNILRRFNHKLPEDTKEKKKFANVNRLFSMVIVEKKLISVSLISLLASSAGTLAFPFALGKVSYLSVRLI